MKALHASCILTIRVIFRNLPENATCEPATTRMPILSPNLDREVFLGITQVMGLQKVGHLMEQEILNRFKILQQVGAASDGLASVSSQTKSAKATCIKSTDSDHTSGQSGQGNFGDLPTSKTTEASNESSEKKKHKAEAEESNALLVLRPELIVPELRELPTLDDMLTVPATLTEATRLIFALRKDMLVLRNSVLKRALTKSAEQIEIYRKRTNVVRQETKQERLLQKLEQVFSKAQLTFWSDGGGNNVTWTLEDYLQSISLRMLCCHRTFDYVRKTMEIPLPSMRAVRSMANCGLMPEVTKRYKELAEVKDLYAPRVKRDVSAKQFTQLVDARADSSDDEERPKLVANLSKKVAAKSDARGVKKRSRADDDEEPEQLQSSSRRFCWDSSVIEIKSECSSSDESGLDSPDQEHRLPPVTHSTGVHTRSRGRVRGKGRGKNRRGYGEGSEPTAEWTGGIGPMETSEFTSWEPRGEVEYPSEDEWDQNYAGDAPLPHDEVPSHAGRIRDSLGFKSARRGRRGAPRPPQATWESPPRISHKKKGVKRNASQMGRPSGS